MLLSNVFLAFLTPSASYLMLLSSSSLSLLWTHFFQGFWFCQIHCLFSHVQRSLQFDLPDYPSHRIQCPRSAARKDVIWENKTAQQLKLYEKQTGFLKRVWDAAHRKYISGSSVAHWCRCWRKGFNVSWGLLRILRAVNLSTPNPLICQMTNFRLEFYRDAGQFMNRDKRLGILTSSQKFFWP